MAESDFWANEPWAVMNRINAWSESYRRADKAEMQRISLLGSWLLAPHSAKGKGRIKPSDLAPPVWEESKEVAKPLSRQERDKIFARHDEIAKKIWQRKT